MVLGDFAVGQEIGTPERTATATRVMSKENAA